MKNSSVTTGNRTRHVLLCSAVPQPTASPRAPSLFLILILTLTSMYPLAVDVEGYCCTCWQSMIHTHSHAGAPARTHTHTHTHGRTTLDERSACLKSNLSENTQHLIHETSGNQTRNPSKREAAYPRLRPRGHLNWTLLLTEGKFFTGISHTADRLVTGGLMYRSRK